MIDLDERHMEILRALARQTTEISHNKLGKITVLNKKTFQRKLHDLVEFKLVERNPPESDRNKERGRKVYFKISMKGMKRLETEKLLGEIRAYVENAYKELFEKSVEVAEAKPLIGRVAFFTSKELPICTIAHFPSESQYEKLKPFLDSNQKRRELGQLIDRVIEFYVSEKENEVYASYEPQKESVFTMSFLSKQQSETMQKAVENDHFQEYWQLVAQLQGVSESIWLRTWKALQDPGFLGGQQARLFEIGFRYNASEKRLETIPPEKIPSLRMLSQTCEP